MVFCREEFYRGLHGFLKIDLPPGSFGNCDPDAALPYLKDIAGRFLKLNPGEVLELPVKREGGAFALG